MSNNDQPTYYPTFMKQDENALLEPSPYREDGGHFIGRDPRTLSAEELEPFEYKTPLKAIRAWCLCCSSGTSEVRKCTAIDCQLWPFRMGTNPFHKKARQKVVKTSPASATESQASSCQAEPDAKRCLVEEY